jgi:hypothetical protein
VIPSSSWIHAGGVTMIRLHCSHESALKKSKMDSKFSKVIVPNSSILKI